MAMKTIRCGICGRRIRGGSFEVRMAKLRRHRKRAHPRAHRASIRKAARTRRRRARLRGILRGY